MAKGGFRGMPGGMNQAAMMKQAQKMQQEMLRMQEEMENRLTPLPPVAAWSRRKSTASMRWWA